MMDKAREHGIKVLVTSLGAAALALAQDHKPDAILLDIYLTDMQGWRVLERLKNDMNTRHIPVCVISTDESRRRALDSGALMFIAKPLQNADALGRLLDNVTAYTNREQRRILVIEPDDRTGRVIAENIAQDEVDLVFARNVRAAKKELKKNHFDCIVVGAGAPDIVSQALHASGFESVLSDNALSIGTPIVIFGEGNTDDQAWKSIAEKALVQRAHSPERLLDYITLYLHRNIASLPQNIRKKLSDLHQSNKVLANKKALVVDDDARNIFALTSVMEEHNMNILSADSGREAIRILEQDPEVDIVLMDIMMPEMDGMETIREIRKISRLKNLPIVAVTAKAMKGDREKCIEAGAWDYLSKPVDIEQMMSVLRAWLHR
jgi:CheY-like chemotaxis protein